jgi:two-component system LytT family response regulator
LKPFGQDRFRAALDRARRRLAEKQKMPPSSELKAAASGPGQFAQRVVVKDGARIHIIPVEKLDYAEAQDDYVALHSEKKSWLKQLSMSSLESTLDPSRFVRVHRSYLLNVEKILKIEPYTKDTKLAVLVDGAQIPISRAGYARLKELMDIG